MTTPAVVIRPILLPAHSGEPDVAVRAGGDAVRAPLLAVRTRKLRDDARRRDPPDLVAKYSVNQRLPSGPAAM